MKIALEEANKHNARRVTAIRIKMGVLSDLLPDCINSYFAIISKGSIAEGADIVVDKLPLRAKCKKCGTTSEIEIRSFRCPKCSSQDMSIIQGNEFYIDSLEVE